jgi:hypothetical protein
MKERVWRRVSETTLQTRRGLRELYASGPRQPPTDRPTKWGPSWVLGTQHSRPVYLVSFRYPSTQKG